MVRGSPAKAEAMAEATIQGAGSILFSHMHESAYAVHDLACKAVVAEREHTVDA